MAGRFVSGNPGRDVQRVGTARFLGQDPGKIHEPVWAVTGNLGDSQCYLGVTAKVDDYYGFVIRRLAAQGALPPGFSAEVPPSPRALPESETRPVVAVE